MKQSVSSDKVQKKSIKKLRFGASLAIFGLRAVQLLLTLITAAAYTLVAVALVSAVVSIITDTHTAIFALVVYVVAVVFLTLSTGKGKADLGVEMTKPGQPSEDEETTGQ